MKNVECKAWANRFKYDDIKYPSEIWNTWTKILNSSRSLLEFWPHDRAASRLYSKVTLVPMSHEEDCPQDEWKSFSAGLSVRSVNSPQNSLNSAGCFRWWVLLDVSVLHWLAMIVFDVFSGSFIKVYVGPFCPAKMNWLINTLNLIWPFCQAKTCQCYRIFMVSPRFWIVTFLPFFWSCPWLTGFSFSLSLAPWFLELTDDVWTSDAPRRHQSQHRSGQRGGCWSLDHGLSG